MERQASAHWTGKIQDGQGTLSSPSGVLSGTPYSFATRFASKPGTNPEELIAAAHAGCFSMALSGAITRAGFNPESIDTTVTITIEKSGDAWAIRDSELTVRASVPGLEDTRFQILAEDAKANCPVSKLLNVPIMLTATLEDSVGVETTIV